jgi:hypothetical protein
MLVSRTAALSLNIRCEGKSLHRIMFYFEAVGQLESARPVSRSAAILQRLQGFRSLTAIQPG